MPKNLPPDMILDEKDSFPAPQKQGFLARIGISFLVAAVLGSLLSVISYEIIDAIGNGFIRSLLLSVLYLTSLIIAVLLRLLFGIITLMDLILFLIFGLITVIVGIPLVASIIVSV